MLFLELSNSVKNDLWIRKDIIKHVGPDKEGKLHVLIKYIE